LTCASAETGEIEWRSRPPLGRGIALIDEKLVILAASGEVVVIEPSPEGYQELTRTPVFEMGGLATAEFSEGVFFVRNLEQMAAVRVDTSAAPQRAEVASTQQIQGELGKWAESLSEMPESERQAAVDSRFADVETSPMFEDGGLAHFFWRGEAEDVGLESDEVAPGAENGLYKLPGTDLFLRTVELDPKSQYTYELTVDYEQPIPDPRNPHTVDNGFNVVSEVRMPEWPPSPHLETPAEDAPRGELDTFPFHSEILDNRRQIQVWRPPGYGADPDMRYPLLVVNHGDNLLRGSLMRNTLDNLVGESVAPLVAVFVPRITAPEYAGPQVDEYVRFLVEELLPHIDRHYLTDGVHRAIMGPGSAGVTAVYASLQHSEVFQQAAVQSFYPIEPAQERFAEMIGSTEPGPDSIYIVWSRHDYDLGDGRRADEASEDMVELLRQGGIPITEMIADYSPGWGGWRGQHDEILQSLFPLEEVADSSSGRVSSSR
jgi:enterochelin esterase-like enzyme